MRNREIIILGYANDDKLIAENKSYAVLWNQDCHDYFEKH